MDRKPSFHRKPAKFTKSMRFTICKEVSQMNEEGWRQRIEVLDLHLGPDFSGWQRFANALQLAALDYDFKLTFVRPVNGYLRIEEPFAPPHIQTLAMAVEYVTDAICQRCGNDIPERLVRDGRVWKLCTSCKPYLEKRNG